MSGADRENLHSAIGASNSRLESIDDTLLKMSKQMEEILQLLIELLIERAEARRERIGREKP